MGMQIFEKSGTFNPADWGLGAGDMVQVICVGGGCSGDGISGSSSDSTRVNGNKGTDSKFGTYLSSSSGRIIGRGGKGAAIQKSNPLMAHAYGGGGAGGYIPGVPMIGGNGGGYGIPSASGLGGIGGADSSELQFFSPYCNVWGEGNCGAGVGEVYGDQASYPGAGGNGYGAGGSGSAYQGNRDSYSASGNGGDSGKFITSPIKLVSNNPISVTVGTGGASIGSNKASGKGADGVVIVTW